MKHLRWDFWIVAKPLLALTCWMACATAALGDPATPSGFSVSQGEGGRILRATALEVALDPVGASPQTGWVATKSERIWPLEELRSKPGDYHSVLARVRFDPAVIGPGPLALFTQDNREQITVYANGIEIFRNFAIESEQTQAWYRPYLIPLPGGLLKPGLNTLSVRVGTHYDLELGRLVIGPHAALRRQYDSQYFWRVSGPTAANYVMLLLGAISLLVWTVRRREPELLFLALTAVLWFVNNYHYFADRLPFDQTLFANISNYSVYFAMWATLSFCLLFLRSRHRWPTIGVMLGFGIFILGLRLENIIDVPVFYRATITVSLLTSILIWRGLNRSRPTGHLAMAGLIAVFTLASVHDMGRIAGVDWWSGLDFYFQPFIGLGFCLAFLIFFGKRALDAFSALDNVNQTLEQRVNEARADLARSEGLRRTLEVENAVESERNRLIREMHDGIGANVVTALAVAEQQHQPAAIIQTLRRVLSDLKLTVDSLEPVNGDVVVLIANLRHRMERDLRLAGIRCRWSATPCERLTWLDATNALHVLRIFQEAISNVLVHSQATEMEIGCRPETRDGRAGLEAYLLDNGIGFELDQSLPQGKGLSGMRSRAEALGALFQLESRKGSGTRLAIWMPYVR